MRLLLITFEIDPSSRVLAWQQAVALKLSQKCERVVVLTHRLHGFIVPDNMQVHVFPRWPQRAPWRWVGGRWWMNILVLKICVRERIQVCFIHMNMPWTYRLAPAFRLLNIPVLLWYAHGMVTWRLRLAHHFATRIVTSTPDGFRIPSKKTVVIGQGIDIGSFRTETRSELTDVVSVGRISKRKRLDLMIDAMDHFWRLRPESNVRLVIVGDPVTNLDILYLTQLRDRIARSERPDSVIMHGALPPERIPPLYETAFVHLNLSETGSMDKSVMESLACGCPVLTSNEAFRTLLADSPEMMALNDSPLEIAQQLDSLYRQRQSVDHAKLRALVVGRHDLSTYITRVMRELSSLRAQL